MLVQAEKYDKFDNICTARGRSAGADLVLMYRGAVRILPELVRALLGKVEH